MEKTNKKSKQTALLLAFFFGMLGAHRFYLAKKVSGSIQLLITIIFGFVYFEANILLINIVWVLIDLVLILLGKLKTEYPETA